VITNKKNKNMKSIKIITALTIGLLCYKSYSQNNLDNFEYQITYVTTGDINFQGDSIYARECGITISDTVNISKIHVKIGSDENLSDILNYSFLFDNTIGLPIGLVYFREGNRIRLQIYETQTSDRYFYEVMLEDIFGNLSSPKKWY
jgi:hypothetical protein